MSGFILTLDPEPVRVRRLEVLTGVVVDRRPKRDLRQFGQLADLKDSSGRKLA